MEASAPCMDFEQCLVYGRYIGKKLRIYEKLRPTIKDEIVLKKCDENREYLRKLLVQYGQLCNYYKANKN